ncbi:hypothetical protein DERP_007308 [Dermatophagoides pteronyssinus]|uniref:Chitin-binding type-2 domain-containing protein n=1 Tax=Dermatophagoides pteronyssinus TaxID=6956 RepID=A0ABQ8J4B8_DERPT|nr:hypothetical protein DERP_007308 [Dermatophagoides pteronyssinus]
MSSIRMILSNKLIIIIICSICTLSTSSSQNSIDNNNNRYKIISFDRLLSKAPSILEKTNSYSDSLNSNVFSRKSFEMNKISSSNQIFKPKSNLINTKFRSTKSLNKFLSTIHFDCSNRSEGYYADIDLNCRTFHYCKQEQRQFTFNCPGSSQFNQKELTCENNNFENDSNEICQNSTKFFFINQILYNVNERLIRKWNQNFFQKSKQQSKKKNRSNPIDVGVVDSRKMENFLFPKTFKHFRSLFSRSKNNFSQNND